MSLKYYCQKTFNLTGIIREPLNWDIRNGKIGHIVVALMSQDRNRRQNYSTKGCGDVRETHFNNWFVMEMQKLMTGKG